jgi:hypothetical protein
MFKLLHKLNLNYYVVGPTYTCSCQIWFRSGFELNFAIEQDSVSEGAKHLFSLCEKRYFAPVRNRLRLIQTERLHTVLEDKKIIFFYK